MSKWLGCDPRRPGSDPQKIPATGECVRVPKWLVTIKSLKPLSSKPIENTGPMFFGTESDGLLTGAANGLRKWFLYICNDYNALDI